MFRLLPLFFARPLIGLWLHHSPASWQRRVIAEDSPHVHSAGLNPDRVLLTGDGIATGRGVLTHDLGLPGHLARALSAQTGNATDVDTVVHQDMTVRTCPTALSGINLFRYDVIVLSLGHNEALALMDPVAWETGLRRFLTDLVGRAPTATRIFILTIPVFGPRTRLPDPLAEVVDRHAEELNTVTADLIATMPRVALIPADETNEFQPETVHLYRQWANSIAVRISNSLDTDRICAADTNSPDEAGRQHALEYLETLDTDMNPLLNSLADTAKHAFGMSIAAITFIRSDTQTMTAVKGMDPVVIARNRAFCNITVRKSAQLVIEDTALDSRYTDYALVTGPTKVRFYAGYPIESPDGYRVGALCVMDSKPRQFTPQDIALLRTLAHLAQDHLWRYSNL